MVQGLPVKVGRVEGAAVHRLAALYGLKCSAQGGGKKQTIMVLPDAFLEHDTGTTLVVPVMPSADQLVYMTKCVHFSMVRLTERG